MFHRGSDYGHPHDAVLISSHYKATYEVCAKTSVLRQGTVLTVPKWVAAILSTALPKAGAQRQHSDKNRISLLLPL